MFKSILSNTAAQLVAKFFGAGLTLLTTYYIIRIVGLPLYGDLTKVVVLVAVGFTAIDFGLNAEGLRSSDSIESMKNNLINILFARLILSLAVVIILNIGIWLLPGGYSPSIKSIFWLGSLSIIFQGIYSSGNAWFQYKLAYWLSTLSVLAGSLVNTFLTLYFLYRSPTLSHFVLATTLGYLTMATTTLMFLPRKVQYNAHFSSVLVLLRRSLMLGLILIANVIAIKSDTVILGIFRSSGEVGQYGFAYRIFEVILVLPVFVINSIYPLSLKQVQQSFKSSIFDKTVKYLGVMSILVAVVTWFGAPYLYLVKDGLNLSITVLRLLALSIPFFYTTAPLMWSLIRQKRDKVVLGVYAAAAILNAALNLISIPTWGAVAAAVNTGITELFIFVILLYFSNQPISQKR